MNKIFENIERLITFLILPCVIILIFLIIIEIFYQELAIKYTLYITILEISILVIFIIDLIFKYYHIRRFKEFLKKHWLDVLVVFPMFIFFTTIEKILLLSSRAIYSALSLDNEIAFLLKDSEQVTETIRRVNKIWPRLIRILKIIHYK